MWLGRKGTSWHVHQNCSRGQFNVISRVVQEEWDVTHTTAALFALVNYIHRTAEMTEIQKTISTSPFHTLLTFNEHLCWCGVWAAGVCSQTRVTTCVVLKGLSNDQGVQLVTVAVDVDVRSAVQFLPFTEPSAGQQTTGVSGWGAQIKQRLDAKQGLCYAGRCLHNKSSVSVTHGNWT